MNTSFSKKRHIIEANQRLEERYLLEQNIAGTAGTSGTAGATLTSGGVTYQQIVPNSGIVVVNGKTFKYAPGQEEYGLRTQINIARKEVWKKYPCVSNAGFFRKTEGDQKDNKIIKDGVEYYPNGRYLIVGRGTGKYECKNNEIYLYPIDSGPEAERYKNIQNPPKTPGIIGSNPIQYSACTDNFRKLCYNKIEISKLQSCLGFTGKSVDGYFGKNTETALHNKFPAFKGKVVTKTDINTICSGRAGTAGTSGTAGVTNNQIKQMTADDTPPGA